MHVSWCPGEGASRPVQVSNEVSLVVLSSSPLIICLLALFYLISVCNVQLVSLVSQESDPFVIL